MGRRFESTDSRGETVWLEDGFECYEENGKFKVRDSRLAGLNIWVPGRYDSVDDAFMAAKVASLMQEQAHGTDSG